MFYNSDLFLFKKNVHYFDSMNNRIAVLKKSEIRVVGKMSKLATRSANTSNNRCQKDNINVFIV